MASSFGSYCDCNKTVTYFLRQPGNEPVVVACSHYHGSNDGRQRNEHQDTIEQNRPEGSSEKICSHDNDLVRHGPILTDKAEWRFHIMHFNLTGLDTEGDEERDEDLVLSKLLKEIILVILIGCEVAIGFDEGHRYENTEHNLGWRACR